MKPDIRIAWFVLCILMAGCNENPVPKPRGYLRIDLPERSYETYSKAQCPFTFEYPSYGRIWQDSLRFPEPCWMNLQFPAFKGDLHISYKQVNNNLSQYLEDSYQFKMKHMAVATGFEDSLIVSPERNVYGMIYKIKGEHVASPFQFFLTDSARHFLRASLYFRVSPNNDSLAPVIRFLEKDLTHLITSFRWTDANGAEKP